ncbi:putative oxidoreductase YrbE [Porphyridium purpureum]|uniref:Putative oxidoreductase YrbE n=1 Tax=Porphyridium purpureum TaxID=35688 RepID=A0A5J4Z5E1_PORPP|nr:putative oxidoreductase YrbE [Porphyridium purpureum]|eukprot:POR0783..scf295_1
MIIDRGMKALRAAGARAYSAAAAGQLRVGIIGAGRIGQVHAETLAFSCPQAKAVRIVDYFEDVAKKTAAKYGIEHAGQDYMEIINDDSIQAVWICSPSSLHKEQIIAAAKKGKAIFCEKPMATSLADVDEVLKVVEGEGVKLMMAFQRRYDPNFARCRKAIDDGVVGDPLIFHLTSRDPAPPPVDYILKSGGLHNDMAIHDFDQARFMMKSECKRITAYGACRINPEIGTKGGDIDTALTVLEFENGAFGTVDNCRQSPQGYDQRVEVFGTKGQVSFGNNYPSIVEIADNSSVRRADLPLNFFMDRYMDAYRNETIEFVNCVLNNTEPKSTGYDGRAAMVLALAAKKSLLEKRPVETAEIKP